MPDQALRRDPDAVACARGLKRLRALAAAKEAGNAAFRERRWGDAHAAYSAALQRRSTDALAEGNAAFYAQCFSNRCAPGLSPEALCCEPAAHLLFMQESGAVLRRELTASGTMVRMWHLVRWRGWPMSWWPNMLWQGFTLACDSVLSAALSLTVVSGWLPAPEKHRCCGKRAHQIVGHFLKVLAMGDFSFPWSFADTVPPHAAARRSAVCMKLGRKQDALADAESAVQADPTFVKGFLRRGAAHEALQQWQEAVHDYEKVRCPCAYNTRTPHCACAWCMRLVRVCTKRIDPAARGCARGAAAVAGGRPRV